MQLPFQWDVVDSAVCNSEETVVSRQEHWKEGTKCRECRRKGNSVLPFLPCLLLLSFATVSSLLLRLFSPLMYKNEEKSTEHVQPFKDCIPEETDSPTLTPRAVNCQELINSGWEMPPRTAAILVGLILCRCYACSLWCCELLCAPALPCPSKDSYISFSCPLFFFIFFFFFQTFLLTLPSPSDHVTLSFRIYSQLFRIRPMVVKNRFVWTQFHCYAYEEENQSPLV